MDPASLAERVLDAAERAFGRSGVRGCTMEQIGREAGLSRITVYRHVGAKEEVFRQVVLRNSRRYYALLESDFARADSLRDVVRAVFIRAQANYRGNTWYQTLLELEPETMLRMLTTDATGFYVQGVPFLVPHLKRYVNTTRRAEIAAEWIIRVTISMVGTSGHLLDPYDAADLERLLTLTVDGIAGLERAPARSGRVTR
jgi:AcrR family transcriptional regulator